MELHVGQKIKIKDDSLGYFLPKHIQAEFGYLTIKDINSSCRVNCHECKTKQSVAFEHVFDNAGGINYYCYIETVAVPYNNTPAKPKEFKLKHNEDL